MLRVGCYNRRGIIVLYLKYMCISYSFSPHTGFQAHPSKFFIYFLTVALTSVAGATIAFAHSAMVSVFAVANLLVSLSYVFQMV